MNARCSVSIAGVTPATMPLDTTLPTERQSIKAMVQELERTRIKSPFPETAPAAYPVFYRTYSRRFEGGRREAWHEVCDRTLKGLVELGKLTDAERDLVAKMQRNLHTMPSGRWMWVGGTEWSKNPQNFSGAYNCTSTNVVDWRAFGLMMDLAMMGCGTGAVLEPKYISQLPKIRNQITVTMRGDVGMTIASQRREEAEIRVDAANNRVEIIAGDSRQGWVKSYQALLELSSDERFDGQVEAIIDLSDVRPAGEQLKGFGGMANPVKLPELYERCAKILNAAIGRQLNSIECCLLIDEAAACVVAGNIRRCLPENALVHSARGLVPIKDIQIGDQVQTPLGYRKVVNKFDQGYQDVYEIATNGTHPQATLNHEIAVFGDAQGHIEWKRLSELMEGDRLMHSHQILTGTLTHLPADTTAQRPEQSQTAKAIVIPELTPVVAWLIGFTHGDGYVALGRNKHNKPYGRVEWAMNAGDAALVVQLRAKIDAALAEFGLSAVHGTVKGENTAKSVCSSIRLAEYFYAHIKQPNQPLEVPSFILQASIDVRAAYLAGLMDSDGAVNNRPPHLVTSVYRPFVRQVAAVLSSLGIAGRVSTTVPEKTHWQVKYNLTLPALKSQYNALIAPHSAKGAIRVGLKMYGFTLSGAMMREAYSYSEMRDMGFQGSHQVDSNYERYVAEADLDLDVPITVKGLGSYDHVQTYDIEVEEAHCFYCDGYLTHNSAGMRQFDSNDDVATGAKENLWQQDEQGNWRIDPTRDALRMANHTRVFHEKPSKEDVLTAVRKQFHSGEGAIQWAGEAERRAQGQGRYGLNPCVTADTWVHTGDGPRQVKDLIGQQHSTYVNGELFSTTAEGFFFSGEKPVVKLVTQEGFELRLTENHRLLKVTAQTQKNQYSEWVEAGELKPGDYVLLHNHRDLQAWDGVGTHDEGWLLGSLIGDGSLSKTQWNDIGLLRYWQSSADEMSQYAVQLLETAVGYTKRAPEVHYHKQLNHRVINSTGLAKLAAGFGITQGHKTITDAIEQSSYAFYCGFLKGLFDADGSVQGTQIKGVSVRLAQSHLPNLQAAQRMLARLGIVSKIYQQRRPEGYRMMPDSQRQLTEYFCKAQHELIIGKDNLHQFQQVIGFREPQKAQKLDELMRGYKRKLNRERFAVSVRSIEADGIEKVYDCTVPGPACFDANGLVAHNCGEIIGQDFHCNLAEIHLNQIYPKDLQGQDEAFRAGAIAVAALLNHQFCEPRYQKSREEDPIVGVSFTGLFDFFVKAFGVEWLQWFESGRPDTMQGMDFKAQEAAYLSRWKQVVHETVGEYCDRHQIRRPNRCTTVQPAGTKSLLTGASSGWHPPKAQRFIRRITFRKDDPVALACIDYGYSVIPSQSDKDENGNLLNDPFDPRCTEWLVELPVEVDWANLPGADEVAIEKFSALAQFDFYMQVQKHYTAHNTSATVELREHEIEPLAERIYSAIATDEGYISAALLARFDDVQTFPRLPFEPITKARYEEMLAEVLERRVTENFHLALEKHDAGELVEAGPAGCDSDKCLMPEKKPDA
jgi:ribonucleotide reductase, class II